MLIKPSTISVCMIVKNEEELLPLALESVKDFADELVIVDTGSTDSTVALAEASGAKVYHHPWQHDFSLHRNQSLDYATKDWIFILDADEALEQRGIPELKRAANHPQINVITIPVVSPMGTNKYANNSPRMFRRRLGIRYQGAVHNEIDYQGETTFVDAPIIHRGYDLPPDRMKAKFERTTAILRRQKATDPTNFKWPHYLSISLGSEGMYAESVQEARLANELCGHRYPPIFYTIAYGLYYLGLFDDAEDACRKALEMNPNYLDAWSVLTAVAAQKNDAILLNEAAERYRTLYALYQRDPNVFGGLPLASLGQLPNVIKRQAEMAKRRGSEVLYNQYRQEAEREERP